MIDESLHFGLRDFFFVESNETDLTYDYVGFMDRNGVILIGQYTKDGNNALYYAVTGDFATVFAARDSYTYVTPNLLADPRVAS